MKDFINWFNKTSKSIPALTKAAIAHLYFVSIHPFPDGNGRISRALSEKALAQASGQASLIALSTIIDKHRKKYYRMLELSNKDQRINSWIKYFAKTIIEAQKYSQSVLDFSVKKMKFYRKHLEKLNPRQKKVTDRIFKEGIEGFKGGLSAENYIKIAKTSRATATRDLQDLIAKKLFRKEGELRYSRYFINLSGL